MILFKKWRMYRDVPKLQYWLEEVMGPSVLSYAVVTMYKGHFKLVVETRPGIDYYSSEEGLAHMRKDFAISLPTLCDRWEVVIKSYGRLDLFGLRCERIYPFKKGA